MRFINVYLGVTAVESESPVIRSGQLILVTTAGEKANVFSGGII